LAIIKAKFNTTTMNIFNTLSEPHETQAKKNRFNAGQMEKYGIWISQVENISYWAENHPCEVDEALISMYMDDLTPQQAAHYLSNSEED
jgi:hypothetical protein